MSQIPESCLKTRIAVITINSAEDGLLIVLKILDCLSVKARDYISMNPNASMIKQSMMQEYIYHGYLDEEGFMDRVLVVSRNLRKTHFGGHARVSV